MKWLLILSFILVAYAKNECYDDSVQQCGNGGKKGDLENCNALFSGFANITIASEIKKYANHQIQKSFEYLLLASNFGSYVKNRPGFQKQFRSLSDKSWNNGIDLIKHITKRGGAHDFTVTSNIKSSSLDLNEIQSMALTLDMEKTLSKEAHHLHEKYSHAKHPEHYDPEIAHYIEEKFIGDQANTIRKLSGYANDLKKLIKDSDDISLALYMFDEYLTKQ